MKLIYRIIIRIALMLTVVLGAWAVFFYIAVIDEVNDEVDDSLEDYSETIIIRALAGEELPSKNNGSNNQYYLRKVSKEYADEREDICYKDSMVYIVEKEETEPARILTTLFKDDEGQYYELTVSTPTIEKDDLKDAMLGWIIFLLHRPAAHHPDCLHLDISPQHEATLQPAALAGCLQDRPSQSPFEE